MTRYRTSGQDNWTGQRPPMTDARRHDIYGPVRSMIEARPANEPHPFIGALLLIAVAGGVWAGLWFVRIVFGG